MMHALLYREAGRLPEAVEEYDRAASQGRDSGDPTFTWTDIQASHPSQRWFEAGLPQQSPTMVMLHCVIDAA